MTESLAEGFEKHRTRMRAVAYRMLGSTAEADDAVQEAWMRASRADAESVDDLGAWLTTIVARVCLNVLRSHRARPEDPVGVHVPDPVIGGTTPEDEALLADAVGLALLVVLETLTPAERLAFVLHDMFDLPFDEIAPMVGKSSAAARQLASRARRRVRGAGVDDHEPDLARQREVVDAFYAAARRGDLDALVAALDPDVVLRADGGVGRADLSVVAHGASDVVARALKLHQPAAVLRPAVVNGSAGVVATIGGELIAVIGFTVARGRIVRIDVLADPDRLAHVDLSPLDT
ncbi:RNA polymerase sigma factor SigJ [Nonomuraea sp. NPDC050556]|uniref:RNA polymerase sigma factor SigJ n=1 Tax=Nonomuraea sp. NPDC050556 TaxID=3364369 RepID=UPI00379D56F2